MAAAASSRAAFTFGSDQPYANLWQAGSDATGRVEAVPSRDWSDQGAPAVIPVMGRPTAPLPARRRPAAAPLLAGIDGSIGLVSVMPSSAEAQSMPRLGEMDACLEQNDGGLQAMINKQFRMLRFDCTVSLRAAIWACVRDLHNGDGDTRLARLLRDGGGTYTPDLVSCDTSPVPLISDVRFTNVKLHSTYGPTFYVSASAPPGPARSPTQGSRFAFWRFGKRLPAGGMVAMVTHREGMRPDVRMAMIATEVTFPRKSDPRPTDPSVIHFSLSFPKPTDTEWALRQVALRDSTSPPTCFLLENPVLYISFQPFLQSLQSTEMVNLDSSLLRNITLESTETRPPEYANQPKFEWDLSPLMRLDSPVRELRMRIDDRSSVERARQHMHRSSIMDPSQADAIISALTQELALLEGPPGTGKTYTGVQLLRLFVINNVGPIVIMAQTNHALDNILRALYDTEVTKEIVRLGAGSEDPVLQNLSLRKRRMRGNRNGKKQDPTVKEAGVVKEAMGEMEDEMKALSHQIMAHNKVSVEQIENTLSSKYGIHHFRLNMPPSYIKAMMDDLALEDGWARVGKDGEEAAAISTWSFWADGGDIRHVGNLAAQAEAGEKEADDLAGALAGLGVQESAADRGADASQDAWAGLFQKGSWDPVVSTRTKALSDRALFLSHFKLSELPTFPISNRPLEELRSDPDIWFYSLSERRTFRRHLEEKTRLTLQAMNELRYNQLVTEYAAKRAQFAELQRKGVKIVGCTTNGAARLKEIIQTLSPKVLVVEEAGQALEAHILAALSPSIQHLIQIGDPQQLRCITNCHKLSVESNIGSTHYRLNESMMERLSSAGYPMAQLKTQRRMRPQISALIRAQLYPELKDHERVLKYPAVQGATKNVYFLDHRHKETAEGEGGQKKSSPWEASMAAELALYFAKQGCYPEEKGVVILCAYAGQVLEVKRCLEGRAKIKTGDREKQTLARNGTTADIFSESTGPSLTVMVRTIDSFQGEEADVIILSLVRNAGDVDGDEAAHSIGFLKTNNRINVAVSRAKHGLFMLGHAPQLASQSSFWKDTVDQLLADNSVGGSLPLGCTVHGSEQAITDVGDFKKYAPNGGCTLKCGTALSCGHVCPEKCHPADRQHVKTLCAQPCNRPRDCEHTCEKRCCDSCGLCEEVVGTHVMDCEYEHVVDVKCYQRNDLDKIKCPMMVPVTGQSCEHITHIPCGSVKALGPCDQVCGLQLECCGANCTERCLTCQRLSRPAIDGNAMLELGIVTPAPEAIDRTVHAKHQCRRKGDNCGHRCDTVCKPDHCHSRKCDAENIAELDGDCDTQGAVTSCSWPGVVDGKLCTEPCERVCPHQKCSLPCYMPCKIKSCDRACPKLLDCGHPCPSESCASQSCSICLYPLRILTAQGIISVTHQTRRQLQKRIVTHDCGMAIDIPFLDTVTAARATLNLPPACPSCGKGLTTPRYFTHRKQAVFAHFERHVLADLRDRANVLGQNPGGPSLSTSSIDNEIATNLGDVILPAPGRLPKQRAINDILSLPSDLATAQPVTADMLEDILSDVFCFSSELEGAWVQVTELLADEYARIEPLCSPPIHTAATRPYRMAAILSSIGSRLVLAFYAQRFVIALRDRGSRDPAIRINANYAAHLFDILMWTFLRSCDRDLKIAVDYSECPGTSRAAIAGYRIVLSQQTTLAIVSGRGGRVGAELDRMLAKAEGATKESLEHLKDDLAGSAEGEKADKALQKTQAGWRQIRAAEKAGRVYDAGKGMKAGLELAAGIALGLVDRGI